MFTELITKSFRRIFLGKTTSFTFLKVKKPSLKETVPNHLYVHIPFCKNLCPYCPYNKIEPEKEKVKAYFQALGQELALYQEKLKLKSIDSVYIGGGSPSLFKSEIASFIASLKKIAPQINNIAIELFPTHINNSLLSTLKQLGVNQISLGVQSFQKKCLEDIGRNYGGINLNEKIELCTSYQFESINVDLMFALKGQKVSDIKDDLDNLISLGIDQITSYPLFTFPYTSVGEVLKIKKVKMPKHSLRRKQYNFITNYLEKHGYKQSSVWSFKKNEIEKYSSVTREYYLGLGAGAGSQFNHAFYLNTFSVSHYIDRLQKGKHPTALEFRNDRKFNDYFWLYWRFYETSFDLKEFHARFKGDWKACSLLKILEWSGFATAGQGRWTLNQKGSYWVHLCQNYFSLNYINKIWGIAMKEPFPEKIPF